jgi:ADP-ribosylglycohydrolase
VADGGGVESALGHEATREREGHLAIVGGLAGDGAPGASVGRAYLAWGRSGPFDIGTTTSAGLRAIAAGRAPASESQANGALMRVSPLGILAAGAPEEAARLAAADAGLTHPHPVCRAASAAYAAAIAVAIAGAGAGEMRAAAHRFAGDDAAGSTIRARLEAARAAPPEDFQREMGWVLTAFQNAFHHLAKGTPLPDAVAASVACGGDTDTNAAICGALLGAAQGRDAIPLQWRNAVLTCRPVDAPGVRHPRPPAFWPDDALELAEALLTARETM